MTDRCRLEADMRASSRRDQILRQFVMTTAQCHSFRMRQLWADCATTPQPLSDWSDIRSSHRLL